MSYSTINRVVLVGRLVRDAELGSLPSGTTVCRLRLACNSSKRGPGGRVEEKPNYFDVDVFGADADNAAGRMRKGGHVAVEGRLQWREWKNRNRQRQESVSVAADTVQFLGSLAGDRLRQQQRELTAMDTGASLVF